jgi:hypothetical protein
VTRGDVLTDRQILLLGDGDVAEPGELFFRCGSTLERRRQGKSMVDRQGDFRAGKFGLVGNVMFPAPKSFNVICLLGSLLRAHRACQYQSA